MDTGEGHFKMLKDLDGIEDLQKEYPNFGATFQVGEIVEIRDSRFEISKIIRNGLKLRLLPK